MSKATIVDLLIENIKTDQNLLADVETNIDKAKDEKRAIISRLKAYQKDISVLLKYADSEKKKELEALGFDFSETERGVNPVASIAYDLVVKTKGNKLTNAELYEAYVNFLPKKENAVSYTEFNIKCRSLFNTQRLIRKKGNDPKSSRDDSISLNGSELQKQSEKQKKKA